MTSTPKKTPKAKPRPEDTRAQDELRESIERERHAKELSDRADQRRRGLRPDEETC